MYAALERPVRKIIENAGEDGGRILGEMERQAEKNKNIGFNVMTMNFGDMIKQGIMDPAKVTRSAVQNAVSVATMILTTECLVADTPKEDNPLPPMPGGMGGMGGMPGMM